MSAAVPMMKVLYVCGIHLRRPPMSLRMSKLCTAWLTEPAPRNRQALKKAWVNRWKNAAVHAPMPSAMTM